ncbi:MAG TPA: hypothetical protein VFE06_05410 [Acidobacteriaceae bacterium]|nr:hypothetical protein [Acidobacteriaceae bacterium]
MEVKQIVVELEKEIARLKEARALLAGAGSGSGKRRGRPPGKARGPKSGKRRLSPEGRKRISDALKRRWAARRKADKSGKAA